LLQKLAESCISPAFETSEGCKKLQNIAIPDRETGLINALQADAAKKTIATSSRRSGAQHRASQPSQLCEDPLTSRRLVC
jgi:hypothetical protein